MWKNRPRRRALLIQSIHEFLVLIEEPFESIVQLFGNEPGFCPQQALRWIVCEELELCYGLFDTNHKHNAHPYSGVHNRLDMLMGEWGGLSRVFCQYIKAPQIYDDNNDIEVVLRGWDLYLTYYSRGATVRF